MSTVIKVSNMYGTTLSPEGAESLEIHLTPTLGLDTQVIQDAVDEAEASAAAALVSENNAAASEAAALASENAAASSESNAAASEAAALASENAAAASEAAALASENAAATSEANAATSESNASDSEAAALASENAAAASAAAALASQNAAATSEANAATSETNAANSAAAALASENAADSSETNAANSAAAALASENAAATSEANAATSETNAATSETNAAASELAASNSEDAAQESETNAASSAASALASKNAAATSESNAATSESNAAGSAASALSSKNAAAASASAAATSEANAAVSETNAANSAQEAADSAAAAASALRPRGDWDASSGNFPTPTLVPDERADFYQISVGGTMTDANPAQPDVTVAVGDQLYWHLENDIWYKIDNTDQVTSVAGKQGAVVLNKNDVGLTNVDNTSDVNKPISTAQQAALDRLEDDAVVNAGTVDGLNSTQFVRSDANDNVTGELSLTKQTHFTKAQTNGRVFGDASIKVAPSATTNAAGYTTIALGTSTAENYGIGVSAHRKSTSANPDFVISHHNNNGTGTELLRMSDVEFTYKGNRVLTVADEGTGNGLDADTVDGLHASAFIRSNADDTATGKVTFSGGVDFDMADSSEKYRGIINSTSGWARAFEITNVNGGYTSAPASFGVLGGATSLTYVFMGEGDYNDANNFRVYPDGNLKVGSDKVWTARNHGEGSGLDADTVDGQHASEFVTRSGGEMTGELRFPNDTVYERSFDMLENATPQYVILCRNAGNNDVNGTIKLQRTSGNYQAAKLDIIVSSGSSLTPWGTILSLQTTQENEEYTLVTVTYNSVSYVAMKYSGNSYPDTNSAVFIGRLTGDANALTALPASSISNEAPLQTNRKFEINGDTIWHEGNDGAGSGLDADTLDGVHAESFARTDIAEETFDGGANTTINVLAADSGQAVVNAMGSGSQGTGIFYAGQSDTHGGGFLYNGDGNPAYTDSTDEDAIVYYRRSAGTNYWVFKYEQSSNSVTFRDTPTVNANILWHAGNDGSGSGLDADLLDGLHASSFVRSDQADNISARHRYTNTDSVKLPAGSTAQRTSSPEVGDIRFNTQDDGFEGYNSRGWGSIGGGGVPEYSVLFGANRYSFSGGSNYILINSGTSALAGDYVSFMHKFPTSAAFEDRTLLAPGTIGDKHVWYNGGSLRIDPDVDMTVTLDGEVVTDGYALPTDGVDRLLKIVFNESAAIAYIGGVTGGTETVHGPIYNITIDIGGSVSFFPVNEGWTSATANIIDENAARTATGYNFTSSAWWGENDTTIANGEGLLIETVEGVEKEVELPSGVQPGDWFSIGQYGKALGTIRLTDSVMPIMGLFEDFIMDVDYQVFTFSYVDPITGWKIVNAVGESEAPSAAKTVVEGTYAEGTDTFEITYDVGYVDVFVGGYKLANTEFNAGNGTSVVLNTPLLRDSYVYIQGWNHVTVSETSAGVVSYDNTNSDLTVDTVQAALDVVTKKSELLDKVLTEYSNPNLIINGDFSLNQRGISGESQGSHNHYNADRWRTWTTMRVDTGLTTNGFGGRTPFARWRNNTAGNNSNSILLQRVEDAHIFCDGKTPLTLSFWARTYSGAPATSEFRSHCYTRDASTGSRGAIYSPNWTIEPNTWQRFEWTFTPVEATAVDDMLEVRVLTTSASGAMVTDGIEITKVKLERGSVATPFVPDTAGVNLTKCQRYYWKWNDVPSSVGEIYVPVTDTDSTTRYFAFAFPTTMRANPECSASFNRGTIPEAGWISSRSHARINLTDIAVNTTCYMYDDFEAYAEL